MVHVHMMCIGKTTAAPVQRCRKHSIAADAGAAFMICCDAQVLLSGRLYHLSTCVCMHLEMWAEVKVHSYHAHAHVCASSCICCAQATPLSKLQWAYGP